MNYHHEAQQLEKAAKILDSLKESHRRMNEAADYISLMKNARPNDWQNDNRVLFAPPMWKLEHDYEIKKWAYARWLTRLAASVSSISHQCCIDLRNVLEILK